MDEKDLQILYSVHLKAYAQQHELPATPKLPSDPSRLPMVFKAIWDATVELAIYMRQTMPSFAAEPPPTQVSSAGGQFGPSTELEGQEWFDEPLKGPKGSKCGAVGKTWNEVTFREIYNCVGVDDEYGSDWTYLKWLRKASADEKNPKFAKWAKEKARRIGIVMKAIEAATVGFSQEVEETPF